MNDDTEIIRIELGPLRSTLAQIAEHGMQDIDEDRCEEIASVFRVALTGLNPLQCIAVHAAMIVAAIPHDHAG